MRIKWGGGPGQPGNFGGVIHGTVSMDGTKGRKEIPIFRRSFLTLLPATIYVVDHPDLHIGNTETLRTEKHLFLDLLNGRKSSSCCFFQERIYLCISSDFTGKHVSIRLALNHRHLSPSASVTASWVQGLKAWATITQLWEFVVTTWEEWITAV